MITIPLENGENRIELKYHIPYLQEGMYISAAAFAVLLIDCLRRALRIWLRQSTGTSESDRSGEEIEKHDIPKGRYREISGGKD